MRATDIFKILQTFANGEYFLFYYDAILSNEKYRGVRLSFATNSLTIQAQNPEHEEAEEQMEVGYDGSEIEIGFNVTYLLDALAAIDADTAVADGSVVDRLWAGAKSAVRVRKVTVPVAAGRNLAVLTEAAVRNTILQLRGIDTYQEFVERHRRAMERDAGG